MLFDSQEKIHITEKHSTAITTFTLKEIFIHAPKKRSINFETLSKHLNSFYFCIMKTFES